MRRALRIAGLALGVCGASCDTRLSDLVDPGGAEPEHRGEPGTLIVGSAADAIKLDPARVTDNESVSICEQIYDHLVRYTPTSTEVEPSLARSWEVSPDGTVWTFHLREGVKFHDGTPLDADAVVFSFDRQRDPFHANHESDFQYWDGQYHNIEKIRAINPLTVEIKIERSYAPFLTTLAMFPVSIVSPTAVKRWGSEFYKHPIGTGPFELRNWVVGDRIVLQRNEDYWGEKPRVKRIVFRAIPDARQRLVALEGGAIDVAFSLQPSELQYVQLHPDLHLHRVAGQNVAYVAMNTRKPPFDNLNVRRAINHAINKEPIVKLIYQGLGVPARGPVPPSLWSYREDLPDYEYNPVLARAMLAAEAAAGRLDLSRKYTFYVPRTPRSYLPEPETVARFIQRNLQEVGFQTELVIQDFYPHLEDVQNGRHEMCLFGWAGDNGDPDNFLYVLFDRDTATQGTSRNVAFFDNAELHGILIYAQETSDRNERTRFYEKAQEIVHREAPWVPLAHSEMAVATRDGVEGFAIHPSALVYYRTVRLVR